MKQKEIVGHLKKEGPLLSFIVLFTIAAILYPPFLSGYNIYNLFREVSVIGLLGLGMTLVIISGGIDLSVGSVLAVATVTVAQLSYFLGSGASILATLALCTLIGLTIGVLIATFKIEPFIVTLAGLMFARGLALIISNENSVKINREVYRLFEFIGRGKVVGLPVAFIIFLLVALILTAVLKYTHFGRVIYSIGSNESGAETMGLKVEKTKKIIYTINGFLAGLAGIILASRLGAGQPSAGTTYELKAILSVVIGGTLITGGVGKVRGTVTGIFILMVIENMFNMEGLGTFYRNVILGAILLTIVILQKGIGWQKSGAQ